MSERPTYYEVLEILQAYKDANAAPVSVRKISESSTLTEWEVRREVGKLKKHGLVTTSYKGVDLS
jgi:DNA-binding IscR family transcriptional regulator